MPHAGPVNWQPIIEIPLVVSMMDGAGDDSREYLETLCKARRSAHELDDATIDRVERVYNEQLEFVGIYAQQLHRWRTETPSADQLRELDRMEEQNRQLRDVTVEVLAVASGLRNGTIDRIM